MNNQVFSARCGLINLDTESYNAETEIRRKEILLRATSYLEQSKHEQYLHLEMASDIVARQCYEWRSSVL